MKRIIVGILILLSEGMLLAQGPRVPSKMILGDMKLKITDGARAEIQKNVDELTRHPRYFNAKVDLANQYFPFIEDAFKKEGIPEDIKYLVIQESGLISDAVSSSNAVGYWQFKDFTAVEMGLRVDRHIDERKNIVSSSVGAAKYMKMNNGYFDNWVYAIQAYQMGAGGALKVTDKKLYGAKQMTISKKTYWYVKKFLAHKVAYENAIGKTKPSIYLSAYKPEKEKSLKEISKKFNVVEEELGRYNKWLKKGVIPSDKKYTVIIPDKQLIKITDKVDDGIDVKDVFVKKAPTYNQAQAKLFPMIKPWKGSAKYSGSTVNVNRLPGIIGSKDDKLVDLARKGNVSLSDFLSVNDIEIDHKVVDGEVYYFKKKKAKAKVYYHVVHPNETLWSISQKYGIQLKKLLMKNRMVTYEKVRTGRVLWMRHIRAESTPVAYEKMDDLNPIKIEIEKIERKEIEEEVVSEPIITEESIDDTLSSVIEIDSVVYDTITHSVQRGDTYYNIANRYEASVLELVRWNKLRLTDKLSVGQELIILMPKSQQARQVMEEPSRAINIQAVGYYVVQKGDTLYSISRKHGISVETLKEMNNKTGGDVAIGEQLIVRENK